MRIFNRIIVALLLIGLFILGVFGVVYSLGLFGYSLSQLPQTLGLQQIYSNLQGVVRDVENGNPTTLTLLILIGLVLLGLILLILELKPSSPKKVKLQKETYATRKSVKDQVLTAADRASETLGSSAKVKARRSPGAKINLKSKIRRGEDTGGANSSIKDQISGHLDKVGIPVSQMKVKLSEADPRSAGEKRVN